MYQAESASVLFKRGDKTDVSGRTRARVSKNVVLLGLVSLLTDVSSEMVSTVLPIYAIVVLGASPLAYGFIDGLYQGAAALVRIASGVLGDRWGRYKQLAVAGYSLSAVCRVGLLAFGASIGGLSVAIFTDRVGKGIRTAPRDALITLSSARERLGTAFGVHRAMDTAGAMLGPLVAVGILLLAPGKFDAVFAVSLCFAILGVAVLVLFVQNKRREQAKATPDEDRPGLRAAFALLSISRYRTLTIIGSLLGLVTISDAFIYLGLQRSMDLDNALFPLLFVGSALAFMVLAVPVGKLADRIGRARVFVGGYALLPIVYSSLLLPSTGVVEVGLALLMLGTYYAATDGVLSAAAGALVPSERVGSALGLLVTATSLAKFAASILFGLLWTLVGLQTAALIFLIALVLVTCAAAATVGRPGWSAADA
ncbi:MAG TPA: MFS transporter [Thermoleophilaceae bacterium]